VSLRQPPDGPWLQLYEAAGGPRVFVEVLRRADDDVDGLCDRLLFQILSAVSRW
jgi:hypothetical protein